jgi:hypothetical protein
MSTELTTTTPGQIIEAVIAKGDLGKLSPEERTRYYGEVCRSVGLNPLTKPFEYITLNGKLTLYARKDATDQLRSLRGVSVTIASREQVGDVYVVTARATTPDGRTDESIGAVAISSLKGDALANSLMKAETKAKRRVTLSICGLGMLDETEMEIISGATVATIAPTPALPAPTEPLATQEQVTYLGHILDALNEHGVEDDKLLTAVRNITRQPDITLEAADLLTLSGAMLDTVIARLNTRLEQLDADKAAQSSPPASQSQTYKVAPHYAASNSNDVDDMMYD